MPDTATADTTTAGGVTADTAASAGTVTTASATVPLISPLPPDTARAADAELIEDDTIVEEISIDGMCGVY